MNTEKQQQRYWVVVSPSGGITNVPQEPDVLGQLYHLIGGPHPTIDTVPLFYHVPGAPEDLVAVVHDEGLLHPALYPMNRRVLGLAGTVVIGTVIEVQVDDGDGNTYPDSDLGGAMETEAISLVNYLLANCPLITREAAEKMRQERLSQGFVISDLDGKEKL